MSASCTSALEEPESKRPRLDESDLSDSDAETIYSYQGYETAYARDSGDDWSPAEEEITIHHPFCNGNCSTTNQLSTTQPSTTQAAMFQVGEEYEIASDSDSSSNMSTESSSGMEDCVLPIIAAAAASDAGFFADTSDVSFSDEELIIRYSPLRPTRAGTISPDSDPAIHPTDKWKCVVCNRVNTPKMRYCNACYQVRKGWLPARPKRRVRNRRKAEREARGSGSRSTRSVINSFGSDTVEQSSFMDAGSQEPSEDVVDGPMGNGDRSSQEASQPSCSQESQPSTSQASAPSSQESNVGPVRLGRREFLCENCGMRPCNGGFLHGLTTHNVYCYFCSKQMWRARKTCPVCRRTIQQVIKVFSV